MKILLYDFSQIRTFLLMVLLCVAMMIFSKTSSAGIAYETKENESNASNALSCLEQAFFSLSLHP